MGIKLNIQHQVHRMFLKAYTFKSQPHRMVKCTQTIRWQLPTNCLSVFDHFVRLVLKGLKDHIEQLTVICNCLYSKKFTISVCFTWCTRSGNRKILMDCLSWLTMCHCYSAKSYLCSWHSQICTGKGNWGEN